MTAATDTLRSTSLRAARTEAVVTWAYAGGFGIPAIPVGVYLPAWLAAVVPRPLRHVRRAMGEPPGRRALRRRAGGLRRRDGGVSVGCVAGVRGSRRGALAGVALLPVEAVFWIGFALPIPCLVAAARVALLAAAWRRLR